MQSQMWEPISALVIIIKWCCTPRISCCLCPAMIPLGLEARAREMTRRGREKEMIPIPTAFEIF